MDHIIDWESPKPLTERLEDAAAAIPVIGSPAVDIFNKVTTPVSGLKSKILNTSFMKKTGSIAEKGIEKLAKSTVMTK